MANYSNRSNEALIRDYTRLDNNTSAYTIAEEARRMNAVSDMFTELTTRNIPNLDALLDAERARYWKSMEFDGE